MAEYTPVSESMITSSLAKARGNLQFPRKLHLMLLKVERTGITSIISWLPDGRSFKVHKKDKFTELVMPEFFSTSKYKSFQRSLNLWGFETVSKGPDKGVCNHPLFVRGDADLCNSMKRIVVKGKGKRADPSLNNESAPGPLSLTERACFNVPSNVPSSALGTSSSPYMHVHSALAATSTALPSRSSADLNILMSALIQQQNANASQNALVQELLRQQNAMGFIVQRDQALRDVVNVFETARQLLAACPPSDNNPLRVSGGGGGGVDMGQVLSRQSI
jgi:hypothetical protein